MQKISLRRDGGTDLPIGVEIYNNYCSNRRQLARLDTHGDR